MGHARRRGRVKFQARRDLPKHLISQLLQAGNPLNRKLVGPMAGVAVQSWVGGPNPEDLTAGLGEILQERQGGFPKIF